MATVSTSIEINAPAQDVWDLVTDLNRMGEWVSIHRDFGTPPPSEVEEGTTFQQKLTVAGTPFSVDWTAVDVQSPERLSWEGAGPVGTTARTTYSLSGQDGTTLFSYENEFKFPAGGIGEAAAEVATGQAQREADSSLQSLKDLAEAA